MRFGGSHPCTRLDSCAPREPGSLTTRSYGTARKLWTGVTDLCAGVPGLHHAPLLSCHSLPPRRAQQSP